MTIAEERYYANVARIARALERIADKLDGKASKSMDTTNKSGKGETK